MASELDDEWRVCGLVVFKKSGSTSWRLLVKPILKKEDFLFLLRADWSEVNLLYDIIIIIWYNNMSDMFCLVIALQAVLAVALALNLHQSA